MRRLIQTVIITTGILLFCSELFAVPAKPGPLQRVYADGSAITVLLYGDEKFHYTTTIDGFLVRENIDGFLYYTQIDTVEGSIALSSFRANDPEKRTAEELTFLQQLNKEKLLNALFQEHDTYLKKTPKLRSGAEVRLVDPGVFPTTGEVRSLVILVEFFDKKFLSSDPHQSFDNLLNASGYSYNGATGSARDYFIENSDSIFLPHFDVFGPVTLPKSYSHYGGNLNNSPGWDNAPDEMVIEACRALDSEINFADYDLDNDGFVDNIYIFFAGLGEANGGTPNTIWPHAANIYAGFDKEVSLDGVLLGAYACSAEQKVVRNVPLMSGIGTFVHEFCHVLGLPDLYATINSGQSYTPGTWSVLDVGAYNNDENTPPYMSAFERYSLGWLTLRELSEPESVTLRPISTNEGLVITTPDENEYFVLENRQLRGWDLALPSAGMLIWHIVYDQEAWDNNQVNIYPNYQRVDLEEANGNGALSPLATKNPRSGEAFPGTSKVTSFTDTGTPNMRTMGKESLNKPVTDIRLSGSSVRFDFMGGSISGLQEKKLSTGKIPYHTEGNLLYIDTEQNGTSLIYVYNSIGRLVTTAPNNGTAIELTIGQFYFIKLGQNVIKVIL